ncbi:MAG: glycosyltransferase family 4 protein [Candidatus Hodarchaeota archaeon]
MNKLNICLVSLMIAPDRERSGFEGIYEYLKKQNHNVKLITGKWNIKLDDPNIIQVDLINKRFFWAPQFIINIAKYLRSHNFDIIHGNGSKGTLPILFSNKKRFISTIHDLGPFETKFTTIPIEKYLIKYVVNKATYITTVSNYSKAGIKYYIPKVDLNKIQVIYNGIGDWFKPKPKEAQKLKEKLNIKGPIIFNFGRIASYKGVNDIITAYKNAKKKIPDLNLIIGGAPDFKMKNTYRTWRSQYKDIIFLGYVPEEEVPIYYSMADILIQYSFGSEGFGNTPLEALACGTPVICSSLKVYREILQDNAIIIPPRKPQLLAEAINKLIKDDTLRELLVKKGQEFIKRYTWESVGKKLENLYHKLMMD